MELSIIKRNDGVYIDSREVAEIIGKRHDHLLRDIGNYRRILARGGLPKVGESDFFVESCYVNAQNKVMPCYLITKRGAEVIANKLTGEKGVLFTFAYVSRFNEMEEAAREAEIKAHRTPRLSEFNSAVKNVLNGMSQAETAPDDVMKFLRGVYEPLGIKVVEDGYTPYYFSPTDIAEYYGIYSDSGRPHGHAVAAIIAKLNVKESQMIVVPYGLVGMTYRYDVYVVCEVAKWITDNNFPREVPHLDFDYHIHYGSDKKRLKDEADNEFIDLDEYTAEELDEICGKYGDCDECPGFVACCEAD